MIREIENPSSPFVKALLPSQRRKAGVALLEGERAVSEGMRGSWHREYLLIDRDFESSDYGRSILREASASQLPTVRLAPRAMQKISDTENAPPIALVVRAPNLDLAMVDALPNRLLVLDRLKDPGNIGTLIRTAAAFDFSVVITEGSVKVTNEKLLRASAGYALQKNRVYTVASSLELAERLRTNNVTTIVLDPYGTQNLADYTGGSDAGVALVLGEEAHGIDHNVWGGGLKLRIEIADGVESLNVAMAGSIALYQLRKMSPKP